MFNIDLKIENTMCVYILLISFSITHKMTHPLNQIPLTIRNIVISYVEMRHLLNMFITNKLDLSLPFTYDASHNQSAYYVINMIFELFLAIILKGLSIKIESEDDLKHITISMSKLTHITLACANNYDIIRLSQSLPFLTSCHIDNFDPFPDALHFLSEYKMLRSVKFSNSHHMSQSQTSYLGFLPHCPNIRMIELNKCSLTYKMLNDLLKCKRLVTLKFNDCRYLFPPSLYPTLKMIKKLTIKHHVYSNTTCDYLNKYPAFTHLTIGYVDKILPIPLEGRKLERLTLVCAECMMDLIYLSGFQINHLVLKCEAKIKKMINLEPIKQILGLQICTLINMEALDYNGGVRIVMREF